MNEDLCFSMYLKTIFQPALLNRAVKDIVKICKHIGLDNFDAIAFRGMSGSMIAPIISLKLNKRMVMVRKENDDSHCGYKVEGYRYAERVIIIDDLIASGNTICNTIKRLVKQRDSEVHLVPLKIVAIILYHDDHAYSDGMRNDTIRKDVIPFLLGVPVYSFMYDIKGCAGKASFYVGARTKKLYKNMPKHQNYISIDLDEPV
jgi:hypothetical protein